MRRTLARLTTTIRCPLSAKDAGTQRETIMSALLDDLRTALEGKIPFQGQRLADRINQEVIVMGAIVAWILGWFFDSLYLCMTFFGGAFVIALVACIPPWPMYKKHPVIWLPNRPASPEAKKTS